MDKISKEDGELMKLAANAAGLKIVGYSDLWGVNIPGYWFNPIQNDADAFRLAVQLGLKIYHGEFCVIAQCKLGNFFGDEPYGEDKYAATRRAIVRAAAEIGKSL